MTGGFDWKHIYNSTKVLGVSGKPSLFTRDSPKMIIIYHNLPLGIFAYIIQCRAPKIAFSWFITTISPWFMVIATTSMGL